MAAVDGVDAVDGVVFVAVHLAPDDNFSLPIHCPEPGIGIKVSPAKTQSAFLQNIVSSK